MNLDLLAPGKVPGVSGIYEILNTANGRRYIGSAVNLAARRGQHKYLLRRGRHYNPKLQNAWNKYGEPAFQFRPLLICAPKDLVDYEQRCLDGLKPEYNIALIAGSSLGISLSPATREKIGAAQRGKKHGPRTAEIRAKISAAKKGQIFSREHLANMSIAHRETAKRRQRGANGRFQ